MLPRWLRPVAVLDSISPSWARDLVRRATPVDGGVDRTARAPYEARIARQLRR
jgi:hypothetical protein